jgi:hypothetical protein
MTASESSFAVWWKSTRSAGNGACVEVAVSGEAVGLRDSKDPTGSVLVFDQATWRVFLSDVKAGSFDRP